MKKLILFVGGIAAAGAVWGVPANAGPVANDHNCAGAIVSSLASPDLGPAVAGYASTQSVDNLGFANCGGANGSNP